MPQDNIPDILNSIPKGDPEVIKILEHALAQAKAGKIVGAAVVMVAGPDTVNTAMSGRFPSTILLGCHQLIHGTVDRMFNKKAPTSLLVPQRRM